jgi:hypothetical protein
MKQQSTQSCKSNHYLAAAASNNGTATKGRLSSGSLLAQFGSKLAQRKWAIFMALVLLAAGMG